MRTRKRELAVLVASGYVFVAIAAGLFHNHVRHEGSGCEGHQSARTTACNGSSACGHDAHDHGHHDSTAPLHCPADDSDCLVCQFLAQKPAPVADIAPVAPSRLLYEVAIAEPSRSIGGVFSAWHSRAPPTLA